MTDIPAEWITAAAEAMEDAAMRWLGRDLGTVHRDDIARAALDAALPLIVAELRDECQCGGIAPDPNRGPHHRPTCPLRDDLRGGAA